MTHDPSITINRGIPHMFFPFFHIDRQASSFQLLKRRSAVSISALRPRWSDFSISDQYYPPGGPDFVPIESDTSTPSTL